MAIEPDRTPAIKEYFGSVMNLQTGLDKAPEKSVDPEAVAFRKALGSKYSEAIRAGKDVKIPLIGDYVKVAACFPVGSTFLLESDLRQGDGTPYKLTATLGPRTDFAKGVVEFSLGGKVGRDAQGRRGIIISEKADPTKTGFSLEATVDTLAGTTQLSPTESTGLVHNKSGKISANARHIWGVVMETGNSENSVTQEIASKPVEQRAGLPDDWEDKGEGESREMMDKASAGANSPVKIKNSNIVIRRTDRPVKGRGQVWNITFAKMMLNEAALLNNTIEPLVGDQRADEHLLEAAIINADAGGKGKQLKEARDRTMEALIA